MAKHPVPKKKTSKSVSSRRYKDFQNKARVRLSESVKLTVCAKCGSTIRSHHVCGECGYYRGKDVMGQAAKAEGKITKIQA